MQRPKFEDEENFVCPKHKIPFKFLNDDVHNNVYTRWYYCVECDKEYRKDPTKKKSPMPYETFEFKPKITKENAEWIKARMTLLVEQCHESAKREKQENPQAFAKQQEYARKDPKRYNVHIYLNAPLDFNAAIQNSTKSDDMKCSNPNQKPQTK